MSAQGSVQVSAQVWVPALARWLAEQSDLESDRALGLAWAQALEQRWDPAWEQELAPVSEALSELVLTLRAELAGR